LLAARAGARANNNRSGTARAWKKNKQDAPFANWTTLAGSGDRSLETQMSTRTLSRAAVVASVASVFLPVGGLFAQTATVQTLDRTNVLNRTKVLETEFGDPARTVDFTVLDIDPVLGFTACQVTASRGLYCLDGRDVRNWPNTKLADGTGARVISCADPALGLDVKKPDTCTAMTVDQAGTIWLAGKKSSAHNLIKVVAKNPNGSCPEGSSLAQSPYCARTYASGRPLLADIVPIDGDFAATFNLGPGTLGLEERKTLVFYDDVAGAAPKVIASGKTWGLKSQETLLTTTAMQVEVGTSRRNFALVSTSAGRILAVDTAATPAAPFEVYDAVTERGTSSFPAVQCSTTTQQYSIRASTKSGRVYLTDRNFCQALSLQPAPATGKPFRLVNTQEDGEDLTFATAGMPPDGPTVAPGIIVDLSTCTSTCTFLSDADGNSAARLSNVSLVGSATDMVLFQIKNIPDCRWISPKPAACNAPDVVVNPADPPAAQYLNVTPLLPREITVLYDSSGVPPAGLPRMLVSPEFRGQQQNGYVFEAFFGVPQSGLQFNRPFNGEFDVLKLAGTHLGCGFDYSEAAKPNRAFDVVTTVSERFISAGGPGTLADASNPNRYVDTLLNTDCFNPTKVSGTRWSLYPYNLEVTPNTDAVFAKLLIRLYDDLEETRAELACTQRDTTGAAPMSTSLCSTLASQWANGKDKLDKCISASTQPKQSSGDQNCSAFRSQLTNYRSTVSSATAVGPDPANRVSEVKVRAEVVLTFFDQRFLPSIPLNGFTGL
jgi:hypothetical protein